MERDADSQSEVGKEKALWHDQEFQIWGMEMLGVDMDFSGSQQEQESQESLHLELEETEIDSLECSDVDSTTLTPLKKKRSRRALGRVRVLRPLSPTSDAQGRNLTQFW